MKAIFFKAWLWWLTFGLACCHAQITFSGCPALFEEQEFTFALDGTDATGRNQFMTTPVTGDQPCGGIGTCEFRIEWNDSESRWEFLADSGSGDFVDPLLIYYNTSASTPNPPSLALGVWVENTAVTEGECAGNLSESNADLTGEVQNTVLSASGPAVLRFSVFPNPASDRISIRSQAAIRSVKIYSETGQLVSLTLSDQNTVDVSALPVGFYFVNVETDDGSSLVSKFVKS